MKQRYLILFSLSGFILAIDQLLKHIVQTNWRVAEEHPLIPGLLTGIFKQNNGFAFGMLQHIAREFQDVFFFAIPVFALVLIVLIFIKLHDNQMMTSIALTTIFSGAVGNLLDRLKYGYVVDFLQFHFGTRVVFPIFNIADISILVGVMIMFLNTLKQREQRGVA